MIYNQKKLDERSARIIADNKMGGDIRNSGENVMQKAIFSFEDYLSANRNTAKPILHISLNPSPDDCLTDAQFASIAREYMDAMGYGDQLYIVYMHEDTGRRHILVVTKNVSGFNATRFSVPSIALPGKTVSHRADFRKTKYKISFLKYFLYD